MKRLILALSLASAALSGCAQLNERHADPSGGASTAEQQRPYPSHFKNDHYYQP